MIGMQVLQERLTTIVRHERGLSYDIGWDQFCIDPNTSERIIWIDAREGQEMEVATILWDTAKQLATQGPAEDEIAHEVAAFAEIAEDPRMVSGDLDSRVCAELLGDPYFTAREWLAELAAVTPDQVSQVMSAGMRTALLVAPEGCVLDLSDLDGRRVATGGGMRTRELPDGQTFRPPLHARMMDGGARRARLVLAADGIAMCDADGDVHLIRYPEVVGVEVHGGSRTVFGRLGCVVQIDPDLFRGAEVAVAAVDSAVDPMLRYPRTDLISDQSERK
jgi:hypothetical protein